MGRHVKEKQNFIEFDLRNVSAKKHKETKKTCIIFSSKKHILPLLYPNNKTLVKKVIFKDLIF